MGISYTYPRVDVSTTALTRQTYNEVIEDTLVLFMPFKSDMGPIDEIKRIHSLGAFEEMYGRITFESFGTTGLAIRNWLNNGGTVYALRHDILEDIKDPADSSKTLYAAGKKAYGTVVGGKYFIGYDLLKLKMFLSAEAEKEVDTTKKANIQAMLANVETAPEFNLGVLISSEDSSKYQLCLQMSWGKGTYAIAFGATEDSIVVGRGNYMSGAVTVDQLGAAMKILSDKIGLYILDNDTQKFYSGSALSDVSNKDMVKGALIGEYLSWIDRGGTAISKNADPHARQIKNFFVGTSYITTQNRQICYPGVRGVLKSDFTKKIRVCAKNPGTGYNNFTVQVKVSKIDLSAKEKTPSEFSVSVYNGASLIERFNIAREKIIDLFDPQNVISEYIMLGDSFGASFNKDDVIPEAAGEMFDAWAAVTTGNNKTSLKKGSQSEAPTEDIIKDVYTKADGAWMKQLKNTLEFPIDLIIDPGYPKECKLAIFNAFCQENTEPSFIRNDINVLMCEYDLMSAVTPTDVADYVRSFPETSNTRNLSIYSQWYKILDPIGGVNQIIIPPTVSMAHLLSYNAIALNQGTHQPIAGINRAVIDGVLAISENPLPEQKEMYFNSRINYTEVSRYNTAIMSQRTREKYVDNTALQFLNNSITTNRMVKELEKLARVFLFEYNDATTLSNLRKVLNQYIAKYVENRTLQYAVIDVQKDAYSEEAIDVMVSIKYTNSIEVINIDLIIE